jgi:putative tryptophan/tyrosine transport system substrate-binding protein
LAGSGLPIDQLKRRRFLALLGSAAAPLIVSPLIARAQQPGLPVVGFLNSATPHGYAPMLASFRRGLKEAGYVEGENVAIEYRWANDQNDRLPAFAADLIRRQVNVIAANGPAAFAAKAATTTIPIVFFGGYDPVKVGLVATWNRPGGNVTGVTISNVELVPKRLELVRELVPAAKVMAGLGNPTNPNAAQLSQQLSSAARSLGLQMHVMHASTAGEIDDVFSRLSGLRADALVIGPDPFFNTRAEQFAALTLHHKLPTIYQYREFAAAGGLMSYAGSITDLYRLVGSYAGRILKGEKPADLPVQQSTKVELFINLKTAKALGLSVPLTLQASADEVIE